MELWLQVIIEWANCLGILDTTIYELNQLEDQRFYQKLLDSFWKQGKDVTDQEDIVTKFLQDEYPEFKFDEGSKLQGSPDVHIASLLLLYTSQMERFHQPMCTKLQHETQIKIKTFLEMIIPRDKDLTGEQLEEVIDELEHSFPTTPMTQRTPALKDYFNSPAARSAQNYKIMTEQNRKLLKLKSDLEVERYEKIDLQEDVRICENKIANLQKKLQEKTAEVKALKRERMKPSTPQSCKKNKNTSDHEQYYRKEVDRLENQLAETQYEIEKVEGDKNNLSKKLIYVETQYTFLREKLENCTKTVENLQIQGEIKDRELVNLKMTNEELRMHLNELRKVPGEEQSFEFDGVAPLHSSLPSLNNSEVLSTVIEIQLQEAKEESASLKLQLDVLNKNFEGVNQENENLLQLNDQLQAKLSTLQATKMELNTAHEKLSSFEQNIQSLQIERTSLTTVNKELQEFLQVSLSQMNESKDTLNLEVDSLKCTISDLELSLRDRNVNIDNLNMALAEFEEKDKRNFTEASALKKTIKENASKITTLSTTIEQCTEKITRLKQVEVEKGTLDNEMHRLREEIAEKEILLNDSKTHITNLEENFNISVTKFNMEKEEVLKELNESRKKYEKTVKKVTDDFQNEQLRSKELENRVADHERDLESSQRVILTLKKNISEKESIVNDLEKKLTELEGKLEKSVQDAAQLENSKETLKMKYENVMIENRKYLEQLKSENEAILSDLKSTKDKFSLSQREVNDMSSEINLKADEIVNLTSEIAAMKLEKEHLIRSQNDGESKMKCFIEELESTLVSKQSLCDQLNIEIKLKQEKLDFLQTAFDKLTKETITNDLKRKELVVNLQAVRSNQDAVLKTQEKALQEKSLHLEQTQKEFQDAKSVFCKQLEEEKALRHNVQTTCSELQIQIYKQTKTIKELQETLKTEDKTKIEVAEICKQLENSITSLKLTIAETTPRINDDTDERNGLSTDSNDQGKNIRSIIRSATDEVRSTRNLILHLLDANTSLSNSVQAQKTMIDNYSERCEELPVLEYKIQELEAAQRKQAKHFKNLVKRKVSLRDFLQSIVESREQLDNSLIKLKQKWNKVVLPFHDIFTTEKSVCDELKHIQAKKTELETVLREHNVGHLRNMKPLNEILWRKFLWTEEELENTYLQRLNDKQVFDVSVDDSFSDEKAIIDEEAKKNVTLQCDIDRSQAEVDDFAELVGSFARNFKSGQLKFQSDLEKKLQTEVDELTKEKNDIEERVNCLLAKNTKAQDEVDKLEKKVEELKAEVTELNEENVKLRHERDELSKRPTKEDANNQLKDIHSKYELKLDAIKQTMKMAYNEQVAKLNREQEKCLQDKLGSLQKKMEQQCRKQADEISRYKAHVSELTSQFWDVGEKLLTERQKNQDTQKELNELKIKLQNVNHHKKLVSQEYNSSKHEKKDVSSADYKPEASRKFAVIQEKTTYERRCSIRSIQSMGNVFNAEDEEGEVFDNIYLADIKQGSRSPTIDPDRVSILKQRNALCKPHLKSSYPAEMQFHPMPFSEDEIKAGSTTDDVFNDSLSQSLLPEQKTKKKDRTQTSYKKPGPPTPSKNGGRLSLQGNELKSPNSRILRERNKERATATPRTLKSLFTSKRQDENVAGTPRNRRRSSIFRKYRGTNER